jgi:hypothetical protein
LFLILFLPAVLAGCGNAPPPDETNAAMAAEEATNAAAAAANAIADDELNALRMDVDANIDDDRVYPGSNAAAGNILPDQMIMLYEGGLGVGYVGSHLAQHYDFGQPRTLLIAMATNMRGRPVRSGRDETCRLGPIDWVDYGNIRLNFQRDRFVGWDAAPGGPRLADEDGFGIGSLRRDITEYDGDTVMFRRTARGTEFVSGTYRGLLSSGRADARVTDLWAGMVCERQATG